MKHANAWIEEIEISKNKYSVMVLEREKEYEVYMERKGYPMHYMFGIEKKKSNTPPETMEALQETMEALQETMEMAIANAPDYVYMFDEEQEAIKGNETICESENELPKTRKQRKQQALETLKKCRMIYDSDESDLLQAGMWTDFMKEVNEQIKEIEEAFPDEY